VGADRPPSTVRVLSDAVVDTTRISLGRLGHLAADLSSPRDAANRVAAALVGTLRIGETLHTPRTICWDNRDRTGAGRGPTG
jgi:hypothetical protein